MLSILLISPYKVSPPFFDCGYGLMSTNFLLLFSSYFPNSFCQTANGKCYVQWEVTIFTRFLFIKGVRG